MSINNVMLTTLLTGTMLTFLLLSTLQLLLSPAYSGKYTEYFNLNVRHINNSQISNVDLQLFLVYRGKEYQNYATDRDCIIRDSHGHIDSKDC